MRLNPLAVLLLACASALPAWAQPPTRRPNIIVILSDDMGYSDLGCFGGEIQTPHLDALAANGIRLRHFYNTGRCCPTRASLITGLHPHQAGIGHMTNGPGNHDGDFGTPAYQGHLDADLTTLPEALRDAGYTTLMAGKWHLGMEDESQYPLQRGFDRFYGILAGATNFFEPFGQRGVTLGNERVETGEDFYLTDAITDYALSFIQEAREADDGRPFFLYLAYTAPHWPIQALKPDIDRYRERYVEGWDALREERFERMRAMGVIDDDWPMSERDGPAWDTLDPAKQAEMALRMAIYAAMVDRMDQNIGRVVEQLEAMGELDNTLILFLNDNGGCAEGGHLGGGPADELETRRGYFLTYGQMWANASNTPYRLYKHDTHEGGIATPAIVHWPAGIAPRLRGGFRDQAGYLPDVMPTLLDAARADPAGRPPTAGVSLIHAWAMDAPLMQRAMYWEHEGNAAIRVGRLKLVRRHAGADTRWELYDLWADRTEQHDLAGDQPERVEAMSAQWQAWADVVGVLPWRGAGAMRGGRAEHE
ncbi:MAG: arylsulfatase [Phycisphaerales bacterium JB063]